uniref:RING-type domain-containing protein n=1 Tax=Poecilia latipinna TaxID=48699 RepID=A0A3B3W175_9TELE
CSSKKCDLQELLETFLSCHVCSETFRDPVSLSCNHSFCSSCLQKFWEQTGNKNCPICKRRSQNIGLLETEGEKQPMVCSKHQEDPKLFCKDEQRAVCPVCEFSLHQSHKVIPIEQAVSELKEQLKSDLNSLQDKRNKHNQVEETYDDVIQHSKEQSVETHTERETAVRQFYWTENLALGHWRKTCVLRIAASLNDRLERSSGRSSPRAQSLVVERSLERGVLRGPGGVWEAGGDHSFFLI